MIPTTLPPDGLRIPLRAAFVGMKGIDWLALGHNNLNPLLVLHDTEVEFSILRKQRRPYHAIEYVDFGQALGTDLLIIAWRGSYLTFAGNVQFLDDLPPADALRDLLQFFESKQVRLSPRAQTWLHGRIQEEAASAPAASAAFLAGMTPRLLANFVDLFVLLFISISLDLLLTVALSPVFGPDTKHLPPQGFDWICFLALGAMFDASRLMGTPGKRFLGVAVVDAHDKPIGFPRALLRMLIKWLTVPLTLPQALLFRSWHPGPLLHDTLTGTRIVERWSVHGIDQAPNRGAPPPGK